MNDQEGNYVVSSVVAAAHELKSPLVLIRQIGLVLKDETISQSKKRKLCDQLTLTAERSLRLTSDLTRAARLEDSVFELEPVNSDQICVDVANELSELFSAYGRTMKVKTRRHPLLLVANRDLLRRIVLHFTDNALNYSQSGTAVELQVKALNNAGMVRIGVRDYGPALSSDMWRKLQDRIAKSSQPIHARPESSGLGLFISSQFAEAMHGNIGAIRHRDGATFYVDLPASYQLSML